MPALSTALKTTIHELYTGHESCPVCVASFLGLFKVCTCHLSLALDLGILRLRQHTRDSKYVFCHLPASSQHSTETINDLSTVDTHATVPSWVVLFWLESDAWPVLQTQCFAVVSAQT